MDGSEESEKKLRKLWEKFTGPITTDQQYLVRSTFMTQLNILQGCIRTLEILTEKKLSGNLIFRKTV